MNNLLYQQNLHFDLFDLRVFLFLKFISVENMLLRYKQQETGEEMLQFVTFPHLLAFFAHFQLTFSPLNTRLKVNHHARSLLIPISNDVTYP